MVSAACWMLVTRGSPGMYCVVKSPIWSVMPSWLRVGGGERRGARDDLHRHLRPAGVLLQGAAHGVGVRDAPVDLRDDRHAAVVVDRELGVLRLLLRRPEDAVQEGLERRPGDPQPHAATPR